MIDILFVVVFTVVVLAACYFGYYFGTMDGRREGYLDGRLDADKFKDKHANMMKRFRENYEIYKKYTKDNDTEDSKENDGPEQQ